MKTKQIKLVIPKIKTKQKPTKIKQIKLKLNYSEKQNKLTWAYEL